MKKLLAIVAIFALVGCQDIEVMETLPMNMGTTAKNTQIVSVTTSGSKVTVLYNLTVGAKYSVQVYGFGALEPVKTLPLTAQEEITLKVYEFSDIPEGLYDLKLTDINGVTTKKPLIIKR